jgi:hypothetical protein
MANVYSYIRFSSKIQELGSSLHRQKQLADAWLARHPEHILDTSLTLRDLGKSAFRGANLDPEQGDLGKFIYLCRTKKIKPGSILMLEHLDRFSRDKAHLALGVIIDLLKCHIRIQTLEPERMIDEDSAGKMEVLLPAVLDLIIAHEQSERKSKMVGKAWAEKRNRITEEKLTKQAPAWLQLSEDRKTFVAIPERVKAIKLIFKLACEGFGVSAIRRRLTESGVQPFGNTDGWHRAYVMLILHNRAVLGEYQPKTRQGNNRRAAGLPTADYFPRIVSDAVFYRAQDAMNGRKLARGPVGNGVANLFTGLVRDARDGSTMTLVDKGGKSSGKQLVSAAAQRGKAGSRYISFPYRLFEDAVLATIVKLGEPTEPTDDESASPGELQRGEQRDIEQRLKVITNRLEMDDPTKPGYQTLMTLVGTLEAKRLDLAKQIEIAQVQQSANIHQSFADTKSMLSKMANAKGEALADVRRRLRGQIQQLVKAIEVRIAHEQIGNRYYRIMLARLIFTDGSWQFRTVLLARALRDYEYVQLDFEDVDVKKITDRQLAAKVAEVIQTFESAAAI